METKVIKFLMEWECPPKYLGYVYFKDLVVRAAVDNGFYGESLYASVAEKYKTSCADVERCVRTLIAAWWSNNRLAQLFSKRPTNKECILKCVQCIFASNIDTRNENELEFESAYDILLV